MKVELAKYPTYKPSGVEWIREIPVGWHVRHLKMAVRRITTGMTPSDDLFDDEGSICWFSPGDFRGEMVLNSSKKKLREDAFSKGARRFPANSVLIVGIGATLGKVAYSENESTGNQQINCIVTNDVTKGRFIALYLSVMTEVIRIHANTSTLGIINQAQTGAIRIPVPSTTEQEYILSFLDRETAKIDRLLAVRAKQVDRLQEQRGAVIHHAVTKGIDPTVPMIPSGVEWLGNVPTGWTVKRLKFWVKHISTQVSELPEGHAYLALEHIEGKSGRILPNESTEFDSNVKLFRANDVLFGRLRPYLAKVALPDFDGVCVGELMVLRANQEEVSPRYLHLRLLTPDFIDLVDGSTQGAKMPRASWSFVGDVKIALPSRADQDAVVLYIESETAKLDNLIEKYKRELELLGEYRASLISHAVTGKIDVRGLVSPSELEVS